MTLSSSVPSTLLSGTLALAASACSAQNSTLRTDANNLSSCPVHTLPDTKETGYALAVLSQKGLEPLTFQQEASNRLASLASSCTPQEFNRFTGFQKDLTAVLATLPASKIRATLESLYRRAYVFSESDFTMAPGTSPDHRQAKKELDLWIAAIGYRAYDDEDFLNRVASDGGLAAVISLNAPNLTPEDRGELDRLLRASSAQRDQIVLENNKRSYKRQLDWLDNYRGNGPLESESISKSSLDAYLAASSFFGMEENDRLSAKGFPREVFRAWLERKGLVKRYDDLAKLSESALLDRFYEAQMAAGQATRPAVLRDVALELVLVSSACQERGIAPRPLIEKRLRDDLIRRGWNAKDADRIIHLQQGYAKASYTPLDNYQGRFAVLREYRTLYTQLVSQPIADVFKPDQLARYATWNSVILNRDLTGAPIRVWELDAIRRDVRKQSSPWKDASSTGVSFASRDKKGSLWIMPKDLGLCGAPVGGLLTSLGSLASDGKTLNDLVCQNVELIALLPTARLPEHAVAAAYGVFGVIIARNPGPEGPYEWTPGALTHVLSHEAAHNEYLRENFEAHPNRLTYLAPNERRAYATGKGFLTAYLARGAVDKNETWLKDALDFDQSAVSLTNRRLGVAEGETTPKFWNGAWDHDPIMKFMFQPGELANRAALEKIAEKGFKPLTSDEIAKEGDRVLKKAVTIFLTDPKERKEALDALAFLQSSSNSGDNFRLLLASHPLTRVANGLRQEFLRELPLSVVDADQAAWLSFQNEIGRVLLVMGRLM